MKSIRLLVLPLAVWLSAGCLIRSVHPWLSEESRIDEPSLLGIWYDAGEEEVLFIGGDPEEYRLMLSDGGNTARFSATLHRIGGTLLLVAGPDKVEGCVLLPGNLLLRADLEEDALTLFIPDLESFEERAEAAGLALLPGGSQNDGYLLTGTTEEAEAFVRAQLDDPGFFNEKPVYSFRKLPGKASADPPAPATANPEKF